MCHAHVSKLVYVSISLFAGVERLAVDEKKAYELTMQAAAAGE
jgi:hypothetical protein